MQEIEIIEELEARISPKRFKHIMGVVEAAEALAHLYHEDVTRARLAALLHDSAKELPLPQMQEIIDRTGVIVDAEVYKNGALLHGPVGAILAVSRYDVDDLDVLEAIRVHTTGKVGMNTLDKILFVADYIEKNRDYPGVEVIREQAFIDLDKAVLAGYNSTLQFLLVQGVPIYTKTILGRNDIIFRINNLR